MEHKLAVLLSKQLNKVYQRSELEQAKLQYGLEVFLDNAFKVIVIVILSILLGMLKETILVFVGFGFLRISAGGFHFDKNYMCWLFTLMIMLGGGYLGKLGVINWWIAVMMLLVSLFLVVAYAPSRSALPIEPEIARGRKAWSIVKVMIYLGIAICFRKNSWGTSIAIGTLCEAISILPICNRKYATYDD